LDEVAAAIIEREGATYEQLEEPVRLMQEYLVAFFDAVFAVDGPPAEDSAEESSYFLFDNTTDPMDIEDEIERLEGLLDGILLPVDTLEEKDEM